MAYTVFHGCSFTAGAGFALGTNEPGLWTNLITANVEPVHATKSMNLAKSGASNQEIFESAVESLSTLQPQFAFVQWTSYPRHCFDLGIESYPTSQYFALDCEVFEHRLHGVVYTKSYLEDVGNRFILLQHPHNGIKMIVKYVNILLKLAAMTKTKIFFINGAAAWDQDFFSVRRGVLPSDYTKFTQKILETETRDDQQVFELYAKMHGEYQALGGIQESHWLNLYHSIVDLAVDRNDDGKHPGIQSNRRVFDLLERTLKAKLQA